MLESEISARKSASLDACGKSDLEIRNSNLRATSGDRRGECEGISDENRRRVRSSRESRFNCWNNSTVSESLIPGSVEQRIDLAIIRVKTLGCLTFFLVQDDFCLEEWSLLQPPLNAEPLNTLNKQRWFSVHTTLKPNHLSNGAIMEEIFLPRLASVNSLVFLLLILIQSAIVNYVLSILAQIRGAERNASK